MNTMIRDWGVVSDFRFQFLRSDFVIWLRSTRLSFISGHVRPLSVWWWLTNAWCKLHLILITEPWSTVLMWTWESCSEPRFRCCSVCSTLLGVIFGTLNTTFSYLSTNNIAANDIPCILGYPQSGLCKYLSNTKNKHYTQQVIVKYLCLAHTCTVQLLFFAWCTQYFWHGDFFNGQLSAMCVALKS